MRHETDERIATACVFILLLSITASAGTIRHDRDDVLYTDLAAQSRYAAVGRIDESTSTGGILASGTLVAEDWVLTAGHVVEDGTIEQVAFTLDGVEYDALNWFAHPDYTGEISVGFDLALIRLTEPVTAVSPATIYTGTGELEQTGTVVGFGRTGTGRTGAIRAAGTKRAGDNLIGGLGSTIGYSDQIVLADFDRPHPNATGKAAPLDLEYCAAPGDSGGGWFAELDGQTQLVGVTSFLHATDGDPDADYGDIMGATRVTDFADWLGDLLPDGPRGGDATLNGVIDIEDLTVLAANWMETPRAWATGDFSGDRTVDIVDLTALAWNWSAAVGETVPEPGSLVLLGLGAPALLQRRRISRPA